VAKNIDIVLLRSFTAVINTGGVSKAALALHVTQSAISQHIKRLETLLNTQLFDRIGRNITLTPQGEALQEYAHKMLQTNDDIIRHFAEIDEPETTTVSIGLSEHISHVLLPNLLLNISKIPHIDIDAKIGINQGLYSDLESGLFDMALLVSERGLHNQKAVAQYQIEWVSSPEMPALDSSGVLPLVVYDGPCIFRTIMISTLDSHNIPWKVVYTASSIGDLKAALAAKMGFSALLECEIDGWLTACQSAHQSLPDLLDLPDLPKVDIILRCNHREKNDEIDTVINSLKPSIDLL